VQVFGVKPLCQIAFELVGRFSGSRNLTNQRIVDAAVALDLYGLTKVGHLENGYVENVERTDPVGVIPQRSYHRRLPRACRKRPRGCRASERKYANIKCRRPTLIAIRSAPTGIMPASLRAKISRPSTLSDNNDGEKSVAAISAMNRSRQRLRNASQLMSSAPNPTLVDDPAKAGPRT
jgi:hypothetical protein